jgi:hypothetical protein
LRARPGERRIGQSGHYGRHDNATPIRHDLLLCQPPPLWSNDRGPHCYGTSERSAKARRRSPVDEHRTDTTLQVQALPQAQIW